MITRLLFAQAALFPAVFLVLSLSVEAQVYKWQDDKGNTHYSSKAPSQSAKPVNLPKIMRGEVKLGGIKAISCDSGHGGIDCNQGPDKDGSVICFDGFKDATARFRFSCSSPKLEINQVSGPDEKGVVTVAVRNSKSVAAKKVAATFKAPNSKEMKLEGPEVIEPFGLAEYHGKLSESLLKTVKPKVEHVDLTCANCP